MGITPPDLYREHWDPDKRNLVRERCKIFNLEQKLLVCEAQRQQQQPPNSNSARDHHRSLTRKLSSMTLFNRNDSAHKPSSPLRWGILELLNDSDVTYKIVGKITPPDHNNKKKKKTFDFPQGIRPTLPRHDDRANLEAIRAAYNYMRRTSHRRKWKVVGIVPTRETINSTTTHSQEQPPTQEEEEEERDREDGREENPRRRHLVLIERMRRCHCDESFTPRHPLTVNYREGYTPDPDERRIAYRTHLINEARARRYSKPPAAVIAPVVVGGCGGGC